MNEYLTPDASPAIVSAAESGSGNDAQNAFGAEYNVSTLIKTNTDSPLTEQGPGNSVGVLDPVGTSSTQSTIGFNNPDGSISNGQTGYNVGIGWWLGDVGGVPKFSIGNPSGNYMTWDGTSLTIAGTFTAGSLNIPDTTTANSFHVDSSGNAWWGANVATGYTGANARVLADGSAQFKNVVVGGTTVQYVITNSGIFSYGDGSDGDVTISTNTTLTGDKYYRNLTIDSGAVVTPNGYRIFCSQSITLSGNASINFNGNAASGTTPGAALPAGYFIASAAGGGIGTNGGNVTNALGGSGGVGGDGGGTAGPSHAGTTGGSAGTVSAARVKLIANWHLATLLDISATGSTALFQGGSGGGGGNNGWGSGDGGAGGSAAGIVAIYAKSITINSGSSITANGGKGADAVAGTSNGGGGGGGGAGGIIMLAYNTLSNSGSITATGGSYGLGAVGGDSGGGFTTQFGGGNGGPGATGVIYQFQLSL